MADDQQQATTEPMPSSTVSEQTGTQTAAPQQVENAGIAPEASADGSDLTLPNDVSERTAQQFDKLTESNRQLREDMDLLKSSAQPVKQPEVTEEKPLYDPKTGYVDVEALEGIRKSAKEANERAKRAEEGLQNTGQQVELRELYNSYPELREPKTDQDKEFFDEAERIYLHSSLQPDKYGGRTLSQREAADMAKKKLSPGETPEEAAKRVEPKEQAGMSAAGKPSQGVQDVNAEQDVQALAVGTRLGDESSITRRMRNIRLQNEASQDQT